MFSGKKIVSVENGFVEPKTPEDAVMDLKDKTVLPGLTGIHVHLEMEKEIGPINPGFFCGYHCYQ
ncbi:MAG: hypothetical protein R2783_04195 [Gelidibacter sp.]